MSWLQEPFDFSSQLHAIFGAFYSRFSVNVYASGTVRSEFNINIEIEKRAIFLIGVARILLKSTWSEWLYWNKYLLRGKGRSMNNIYFAFGKYLIIFIHYYVILPY